MSKDTIFETPVFNLKPKPGNSLVNVVTAAIEYAKNTNYEVKFTHMGVDVLVDKNSDVGNVVDGFITQLNTKHSLELSMLKVKTQWNIPRTTDTPFLNQKYHPSFGVGDYPPPSPIMCGTSDNNYVNY